MLITLSSAVLFMLQAIFGSSSENRFAVTAIPENLKENSDAVIRLHETTFSVKNKSTATEKIHYAITLLNSNAADHASVIVPYGRFAKINYLKGSLYDQSGKEIKRLKSTDIQDVGGVSQSALIDDSRVKAARFTNAQYPITVEFEYEISYNGLLFYPTWEPQPENNLAIEAATFQISVPANSPLRYKTQNTPIQPQISETGSTSTYTWNMANLPAKVKKPMQPPLSEITPVVFTAPNAFEIEGFEGDMSSWENFGKWINNLNQNKDKLPEATIAKLKQLLADAPDDYTKIQRLYKYLQENTRYVSIQLGIGGWQPFEASFVDSKGYGDCKALSNYMHAMLKTAGINSYYTLIKGGREEADIKVDFPSNQFNHAILCVPMQKDTVWLECTSQSEAMGYSGSFTGDRHALIITPAGGKIVRTPVYQASDNLQKRTATIELDNLGNATTSIETLYTGLLQDELSQILTATANDQKEWLYRQIRFPSYTLQNFEFSQQKSRIPSVTEKVKVAVKNCATVSGKRLFLTPNMLNQFKKVLPQDENRTEDIVNEQGYVHSDIIKYQFSQATFHPEYLPETQVIKSAFGEYSASFQMEENGITYTRTLKMNKGRFPAKSYPELQQFYKKIAQADKLQIVLASKS